MRNSRWKLLWALLISFALIAAACAGDEDAEGDETVDADADGDGDDGDATDEDEDGDATDEDEDGDAMDEGEEGEATDLAGTSVTITGSVRSDNEVAALNAAIEHFTAQTGIEVTYAGSADWEAEVNIQLEAGNPPDLSLFPQPGKLADFARDGFMKEIPADVMDEVSAAWDDSWLGFGNVDGTQYGVPDKVDLKSLVWYQPARFEELGYEVPESWDDLKALTDTAIADGNTPWCVGIESGQATGWPFTDWVEDLTLRLHGADVYDQWVAGEIPFSDERIIEVFNEIRDFWSDDAVFAVDGSIVATGFGNNGQPLVDGDCLMHRQANFFASFFPEGTAFADGSPEAVDVFYFPAAGDVKPVLSAGTLIAAFEDRPEVWEVVKFFGSAEYANVRQAAQAEATGGVSGFLSAADGVDTSLFTPLEQSFLEILTSAEVARFDGSDLMPADVGAGTFWSEGTSFINGDKDAAAAAEAIDASWPS